MNQVNHPLIIVAEAVFALATFRLFFKVREAKAPFPLLIGLLAVMATLNLDARIMGYTWFWIVDIAMYCLLAGSVVAGIFSVKPVHEISTGAGTVAVSPDFLDRWQNRIMWFVGLLIGGLVVYAYSSTYLKQQKADSEVTKTALQVYAQATKEYTQTQAKTNQQQDSILTAIASISATQSTILANQSTGIKEIRQTQKKVDKTNADVKKTIRNTVIEARPIEPKKPNLNHESEEKPPFWKRLFRSSRATMPDSTGHFTADADTLVFY